ncbi:MAG: peptidase [Eubacteriales bacterium]|nr:peptidase [Eubacteriales bacterium]
MSKAESYYFNHLNKFQKAVYHSIQTGLRELKDTIIVPKMDMKELSEIFFLVRLEDPFLFYSERFQCRHYAKADSMELIPEYLFNKKQIKAHTKAMESRIQKLVRPAQNMTEWEKEKYIHDFICENVHYDKLKKAYSHEIIGPLGHGIGVCEGIAKTVKALCDALNLWCIIAICDNNPEKKIKYRHTWNILKLGGKYYHLDATFDNSLSKDGVIRYDYFNIDDSSCFRDHEPVIWKIPECVDSKKKYYLEKKISFTTYEEVRKRCAQAVKKGRVFLFHWRGGYLTRAVLKDLLEIFKEEAEKKEKHMTLSLNLSQAVLQVRFHNELQEELVLEQANEGEMEEEAVNSKE